MFVLFQACPADFDILCSGGSFSHHVKFNNFTLMHDILNRMLVSTPSLG